MAEASKWDKTLDALKQTPPEKRKGNPPAAEPSKARHRSKRSDPAWGVYTLMMKRATHTEAGIILKRLDNGQDLSDLAQELFDEWVRKHT